MLTPADALLARRDPALPGLALLLDPEALLQVLSTQWADSGFVEARATYIRYKRGTNCLVAYRLHHADGSVAEAYAKTFSAGSQLKLGKARTREDFSAFGRGRFVLDEMGVTLSLFPNDDKLPALGRLSDEVWRDRLLRRVIRGRSDSRIAERVAYKPERRFVARVTAPEGDAVLKLYTPAGYKAAKRFRGLPQSDDLLRLPKPLGHSDRRRALAWEWLDGLLLSDALGDPAFDASEVALVGAALARLHAQDASKFGSIPMSRPVSLGQVSESIAVVEPGSRKAAERATGILAQRLNRSENTCLIHGDFYAKQVALRDAGMVGIFDLDQTAIGDPVDDLATFVAHLERDVLVGRLTSSRASEVREALLEGYCVSSGQGLPERIAGCVALALLRLAPEPFRTREPDWSTKVRALVERSLLLLSNDAASPGRSPPSGARLALRAASDVVADVVPIEDPFGAASDTALPALQRALDPVFVQRMLSRSFHGDAVKLGGIRVVRHKPGRRCLLEYDLHIDRNGAAEALTAVAKVRARGFDSRGYELARALWREGFSTEAEDGISIPEPLAALPDLGVWLQRKAAGQPATALLTASDGCTIARRMADAAHKLHTRGIAAERTHDLAAEISILRERLWRVAQQKRGWDTRVSRVLVGCERLAARMPSLPVTSIHRDFYPDHVLIDGRQLTIIDFDLYCLGSPALDIGNCAGHMIEQGLRERGDADAYATQIEAMVERFSALYGAPGASAAAHGYATLTLARHIQISTLFEERRRFTAQLLDLTERRLGIGSVRYGAAHVSEQSAKETVS